MRLIVSRCSALYSGRLDTVLPETLRLLMFKQDELALIHADQGGYKPLKCGRWPPETAISYSRPGIFGWAEAACPLS